MTKAVQIKCNNNLSGFQLHFITNFVLTEPKLVCVEGGNKVEFPGLVEFPARLISYFVMNIIMVD